MRRVEDNDDEFSGHDSFLDVVTNIVGILILLVMVVGLRSSQAVATALATPEPPPAKAVATETDLQQAQQAALDAEQSVRNLVGKVLSTREETILREQERMWLQQTVAEAEQEIAARRSRLSSDDQRDFDLRRRITEAQVRLEELAREQVSLLSHQPEVEEIECEPTPLGKVVLGREIHVHLADDHVAIVPFEELLELMKDDITANVWRLRSESEIDRTVGPINGFRLRYWYVKRTIVARSQSGGVMSGVIPQFSHCNFVPLTTPIGEPASIAVMPDSQFAQHLRRLRPGTTITVWTYPGNYERLRELKRTIRDANMLVAVRPLPPGMPIGASRNGTESVSE